MARLSIGEVERLLGIPASTLRHWERALGLLAPRKGEGGRRVYTEAEVRLLFRIRHLSQRRGLGLRDTEAAILEELDPGRAEGRSRIQEIRGELIGLWLANRESMRRASREGTRDSPGPDRGPGETTGPDEERKLL
jgi:DNA-binding transcriptional MerR regulator